MSAAVVAALVGAAILLWPAAVPPILVPRSRPAAPRRPWKRRSRSDGVDGAELVGLLDSLIPALQVGVGADRALELVAQVQPADGREGLLTHLQERIAAGESVGQAFVELARATGSPEARLIAHAWSLSEDTGAPLAQTATCAAELVRSRRAQDRALRVAVAGAASTIRVLTLLPIAGPLLAVVLGVDPVAAYLRSPPVWACLVLAAVLVLLGRRWVGRQVAVVTHGPVLT